MSPEHFGKLAFDMGRIAALREGGLDKLAFGGMSSQVGKTLLQYGAPALGGAYLAGPGYRMEGALGGALAGRAMGKGLGRFAFSKTTPEIAKFTETAAAGAAKGGKAVAEGAAPTWRGVTEGVAKGAIPGKGAPTVTAQMQQLMKQYELGGRVAAGAGGGYAAGRMLGAQNPYGMQPVFAGAGKENPYGWRPE